jgi:NAD(P)-dependent dehydrogenase (short-subunit alcohol dehydrogenase family)
VIGMTIALITGANKGIGFEIARQLGAAGATVLLGARDTGRGEAAAKALPDIDVQVIQLDVTSSASIAAAARRIEDTHGGLDVLVNNAGIAIDRDHRPSTVPLDIVRATYETNVFGVVAVTNALLPLLRRSPAGRIVNLSSGLGSLTLTSQPDPPWGDLLHLAYMSSKTALNALTVLYANELRDTPILVNAADPGYCATDLNGGQGFQSAADGARVAVELATLPAGGPSGICKSDLGLIPW